MAVYEQEDRGGTRAATSGREWTALHQKHRGETSDSRVRRPRRLTTPDGRQAERDDVVNAAAGSTFLGGSVAVPLRTRPMRREGWPPNESRGPCASWILRTDRLDVRRSARLGEGSVCHGLTTP